MGGKGMTNQYCVCVSDGSLCAHENGSPKCAQAPKGDPQVLIDALTLIASTHKFNVAAIPPHKVHSIVHEALTKYTGVEPDIAPCDAVQEIVDDFAEANGGRSKNRKFCAHDFQTNKDHPTYVTCTKCETTRFKL